jgi:hypothetical protein
VDHARELADIRPGARYQLVTYSSDPDTLGELPRRLIRTLGPRLESPELPPELRSLRDWSALQDEHLFMMMPYAVEIR